MRRCASSWATRRLRRLSASMPAWKGRRLWRCGTARSPNSDRRPPHVSTDLGGGKGRKSMLHPFGATIAPADWPADLQEAWAAACLPGTLLRRRGLAATWSRPTRVHVTGDLGKLLYSLQHLNQVPLGLGFTVVILSVHVESFIAAL